MNEAERAPRSLVLHPNGIVLEFEPAHVIGLPGVWVTLGPGNGYLWFERVATDREAFRSRQWRLEPDPSQGPVLSGIRVLWTRQAALEVHRSIVSSHY